MTRYLSIEQPFDLALSLEMGQAFRWHRIGDEEVRDRDWECPPDRQRTSWYSGVLWGYLIHIKQFADGVKYRVGDEGGERDDVDLTSNPHAEGPVIFLIDSGVMAASTTRWRPGYQTVRKWLEEGPHGSFMGGSTYIS